MFALLGRARAWVGAGERESRVRGGEGRGPRSGMLAQSVWWA